jgi:phosphopantothenoylcysteine decarboxylase/phosphopantothenate--cysteine ligase
MTHGAQRFVGAVTFEGVTGRRVHSDLFEPGEALAHIRLARAADAIVVAPATADFMARAGNGNADDLLSAILLAATCPVLLVPAMNDRMWAHPQTTLNASHLAEIGYEVMAPDSGPLAFGEGEGPGRMPEPDHIAARLGTRLRGASSLKGMKVLVTAGATREPIDPVRFISNYSSGRMGVAIAREARARGAVVTLVAGATEVAAPHDVRVVSVGTVDEMAQAVASELADAQVLIMAAAPADFRATVVATGKIKKSDAPESIQLSPTADILRSTFAERPSNIVTVGFALETDSILENARAKLAAKRLDIVVANRAGVDGEGFGGDTNRVTFITEGGDESLPLMSKTEVARLLLDRVEALLHGR